MKYFTITIWIVDIYGQSLLVQIYHKYTWIPMYYNSMGNEKHMSPKHLFHIYDARLTSVSWPVHAGSPKITKHFRYLKWRY